ncbi:ABC-type transport system periplasmic substrate-binding protein (probable substrate iron/cobalamin) [Halobacterium hubeiense]|uniref:ABC-type transport system periplasmic substrate-binding protein (Probable substrate iron/cobalamin) n=1 Tax=Halobacterium hubeiense TaxID=1407499 RepID=A0A0U5GZU6_9EURY|nr:cobalamin-binding protein [Halobacterium hubeiense]CQH48817.1 ABC-type transport system periplasmic substrate-binding protein (probable substrate iron/cobalamin) [Halobacterium hubeiense]
MRAVSLAPSATATVAALGGSDRLAGVTTHCEDVDAPVVGGWLNPDFDRVADLDPDVVLTSDALQREVRDDLRDRGFDVHHVEPATLDDVLASLAEIGEAVGHPDAGAELEAQSRERVRDVREAAPEDGPVVYCEEWSDPPMAAGNWVPDVVEAAGGRYPFVDAGERSREVEASAVEVADPEHAVVHVCGKGDSVNPDFAGRGWELDADVHVVDDSLLNQPSPRLLDGLETLAERIRGD